MKRLGNLLLVCSFILTGCYNDYDWPRVNGNGDIVSITRNIADFEEIDLRSVADVTITITSSPSGELRITGESNIIPRIETEVRNGRLIIDQDHFVRNFEKISIEVASRTKMDLNLSGAVFYFGRWIKYHG